eukprot:Hpha_TRINITY_DN4951_c0_g1::TRINITY_DN4951_c0_g1_i1::g.51385::m.51385
MGCVGSKEKAAAPAKNRSGLANGHNGKSSNYGVKEASPKPVAPPKADQKPPVHQPPPERVFPEQCLPLSALAGEELTGAEALFRAVGAESHEAEVGMAARRADPEAVVALLHEQHVHPCVLDENGDPPLLHALLSTRFETRRGIQALRLLAAPAVLREAGKAALHAAARLGRISAVQLFVESGVDTGPDEDGTSCLHEALKCDDDDGDSPWEFTEGGRALLRQLAAPNSVSSPDNNEEDGRGRYPLHIAAEHGRERAVKMLVNQGADVAVEDAKGKTALHRALLARSAFNSPGWVKVLALLATAATVNKIDADGDTPLHYAALVGYEAGVVALRGLGGDVSIEDSEGLAPWQVAQAHGHAGVVAALEA